MKRILFFLFIQISVIFSLMADDGGATNFEDWTYGNIYVKEPNDKIALEKELMVCDMDSVRAFFVFKNTTNDTVVVDCAFPIDVKLPYNTGNNGEKLEYEEEIINRCYSYRVLTLLLGSKKLFEPREIFDSTGQINLTERVAEMVRQHDKELKLMNISQYYDYVNSLFKEGYRGYIPNCIIEQDGKSVDLLNVGIESTVDAKHIKMQFHFHHQLVFLPNAYSKVTIKYDVESIKQNYNGEYSYYYDISTGGTWKDGKIKSFMAFVFDGDMSSKLDYFGLKKWDNLKRYGVGYKKDYKPHKEEEFNFVFGVNNSERLAFGYDDPPEYKELQSVILKDIKASASWNNLKAMMDKDRFTSCAITDWQNATLEFTLPQDALGPYMYNGTIGKLTTKEKFDYFVNNVKDNSLLWGESVDISYYFPNDSTVEAYNNVSKICIEQLEAPFDTFPFTVKMSDPRRYPLVFDWARFNDIKHMRYFPAGRYRLSIKDIVEGWQCQDTTLITEFCFLKIPKDIADMLADDAISEIPIFDGFPMVLDPSLIPVPVDSSAFKVDTIAVAQSDTVPSDAITATPKIVIMNREIPLSVLIGSLIFTVLIILGCVYWQKKHKI